MEHYREKSDFLQLSKFTFFSNVGSYSALNVGSNKNSVGGLGSKCEECHQLLTAVT